MIGGRTLDTQESLLLDEQQLSNKGTKEMLNTENKLLSEMCNLLKLREIKSLLDSYRYTTVHLNIILSKVLLENFNNDFEKAKNFLEEYDKYLLDISNFIE